MTSIRTAVLLATSMASLCAAAPAESTYSIVVGHGADKSDWYLSRDADVTAVLDTTPEGDNRFRSGSGAVLNSKPHGGAMWVGQDNTEVLFKAKSAPIQLGGTSWVKCAGEFKTQGAGGSTAAPSPIPTWKSHLKEKPGHIIIVHQYVGPALKTAPREAIDAIIKAQGNWYFNSYSEGGGRYKVTVGRGGDVADYRGVGGFLARKDITPASVVTVDDLGHGAHVNAGPILSGLPAGEDGDGVMQPDTRMTVQFTGISDMLSGNINAMFSAVFADHSVGDNIVPNGVLAGVTGTLNDANGNAYVAVGSYASQYQSYLKVDEQVKVDLLHCFTAEHGQRVITREADPSHPETTQALSVRDAFDSVLPGNVRVIGYTGLLHYSGNAPPTPMGNVVSE